MNSKVCAKTYATSAAIIFQVKFVIESLRKALKSSLELIFTA